MSDKQITVEQLMKYALGVQRGSVTPAYLEKAILIFAAQQRADATQQLQRENAELRRLYVEENENHIEQHVAAKNLRAELAAAKQQLAEAERKTLEQCMNVVVSTDPKLSGIDAMKEIHRQIADLWRQSIARTAQAGEKQG